MSGQNEKSSGRQNSATSHGRKKGKFLSPGQSFGSYEVVELLSGGSEGEVYLIKGKNGSKFAAKVLRAPEDAQANEWRKLFVHEAELAMKVRHPNILAVYGVGYDKATDLCYIIMDYAAGGSLADKIRQGGAMKIPDALTITAQIVSALEVAHKAGVLHLDITPNNILFDHAGRVKLADLGIAKFLGRGAETQSAALMGSFVGKPSYLAPEQFTDPRNVDCRADIYSLGLTLYEMLTGKNPRANFSIVELIAKAVNAEELPDVRTLRPEISPDLAYIVATMLAPRPQDRPESADTVAKLFYELAAGRINIPNEYSGSHGPTAKKQNLKRKIALSACALVGILTLVVAGVLLFSASDEDHGFVQTTLTDLTVRTTRENGYVWSYWINKGTATLQGTKVVHSKASDSFEENEDYTCCVTPAPKGVMKIPSVLDGLRVTAIGEGAFHDCGEITSVEFPDGLEEIQRDAFAKCSGLTSLSLPSTLRIVEKSAFAQCTSLERVNIGMCGYVDPSAFDGDKNIIAFLTADDNPEYKSVRGVIYSKDGKSLYFCPRNEEIVKIAEGTEEINSYAFGFASKEKTLVFPASVRLFRDQLGLYGPKLETIVFEGNAPLHGDSVFSSAPQKAVVYVPRNSTGWMKAGSTKHGMPARWPNNVSSLYSCEIRYAGESAEDAAKRRGDLRTPTKDPTIVATAAVAVPVFTAQIGDYTWRYSLENDKAILWNGRDERMGSPCVDPAPSGVLVVPEKIDGHEVVALGALAFFECSEIDEIVLPKTLKRIGNRAFLHCQSLRRVVLPANVASIGIWAFNDCTALRSININKCTSLDHGNGVFAFCPRLEHFEVAPDNEQFKVVDGILYSRDGKTLVAVPPTKDIQTIQDGVETIGAFAFWGNSMTSCELPATVKEMYEGAFMDCKVLNEIAFKGDAPNVVAGDLEIFRGTPYDLQVHVMRDSKGWNGPDSTNLPRHWPLSDRRNRREISYLP